MSRNLIEANASIFANLDRFCAARGLGLVNAGYPRWIASRHSDRHFMINAVVGDCLTFGLGRRLARLDIDDKSYICSIGFERNRGTLEDADLELSPGFLTVALSELQPQPSGSISEIREVIEWSDKNTDASYSGHEYEQISSLFPAVRFYLLEGRDIAATWNTFFQICVDECDLGGSWIDGRLVTTLRTMCALDADRIPYRVLCRSVFDSDRSSFFLALYRCLEALYAYSSSHRVAKGLGIDTPWAEVAKVLEDELGWHPREESSLSSIVQFAAPSDMKMLLSGLQHPHMDADARSLVNAASKAIYNLRNSIVHYRPAQHRLDIDSINWPIICEAMVGIIVDVYEAVFTGQSAR